MTSLQILIRLIFPRKFFLLSYSNPSCCKSVSLLEEATEHKACPFSAFSFTSGETGTLTRTKQSESEALLVLLAGTYSLPTPISFPGQPSQESQKLFQPQALT